MTGGGKFSRRAVFQASPNAWRETRSGPPADSQALSSEQVRAALEELPLLQRAAIELAYFEEIPRRTVRARPVIQLEHRRADALEFALHTDRSTRLAPCVLIPRQ